MPSTSAMQRGWLPRLFLPNACRQSEPMEVPPQSAKAVQSNWLRVRLATSQTTCVALCGCIDQWWTSRLTGRMLGTGMRQDVGGGVRTPAALPPWMFPRGVTRIICRVAEHCSATRFDRAKEPTEYVASHPQTEKSVCGMNVHLRTCCEYHALDGRKI